MIFQPWLRNCTQTDGVARVMYINQMAAFQMVRHLIFKLSHLLLKSLVIYVRHSFVWAWTLSGSVTDIPLLFQTKVTCKSRIGNFHSWFSILISERCHLLSQNKYQWVHTECKALTHRFICLFFFVENRHTANITYFPPLINEWTFMKWNDYEYIYFGMSHSYLLISRMLNLNEIKNKGW